MGSFHGCYPSVGSTPRKQEKTQRRATVWELSPGVSLLEMAEENRIGHKVFTKNVIRSSPKMWHISTSKPLLESASTLRLLPLKDLSPTHKSSIE